MRVRYSLLLAFSGACGGSGSTSVPPAAPPPPPPPPPPPIGAVVNVSMTDNNGVAPYAFSPTPLTITVGTTVKWTNTGKASHTTTSDETPEPVWNSGPVAPAGSSSCEPYDPYCTPGSSPAGTYQRTFNTVGTFPYHCQVHVAQGMTGTITVTQ